ncbi:hypothetical protein DV735_g5823, partial [Chaetothyriales sp. CBS 134920]
MPFRATPVRALPRIRRENPAPYLPKLKLSELQLAVLSKKSSAAGQTTKPTSSSTPPPPTDINEPPINRGPLWSPLYRKTKMRPTALLAAGARTPLIKFIGKRTVPQSIDHAPHAHPASPTHSLPDSFANYRSNAQQHGPLRTSADPSPAPVAAAGPTPTKVGPAFVSIGARSGASLGPVQPAAGEFFDRSELPRRFRKLAWSEDEIEAVNSGGATSIKPQLSYSLKSMSIPPRLILRETTTTGTPSVTYVLSSSASSSSSPSKHTGRIDIVPPNPPPSTSTTSSSLASSASSTLSSPLLIRLLAPLLPANYPDSVSADYTPYQIYDSIQAFASTIAGLLAARAVLTSLGVGSDDESSASSYSYSSTATLATLLSIAQESIGRVATILFAHVFALRIEAEVKFYRFLADVVNDLAFVLDVLSPSLPAPLLLRVPVLCLASACRAICGVCGGSSKAILSAHFATRGNIGELNAKDASQETVVSLLGMWVGGLVVSQVEGRWATWAWLLGLLAVHLWANWRAVKSVRLRTLNRARAVAVLGKCVRGEGGVGVEEVGRDEALWRTKDGLVIAGRRWEIKFVGVQDLLQALKWERREKSLGGQENTLRELLDIFIQEKYVLWLDAGHQEVLIVLKKGAISETQLQGCYHAMIVASHASDTSEDSLLPTLAKTLQMSKQGWKQTENLLKRQGWQLQDSNLEILPGPRLQVAQDEEEKE